MQSPETKKSNYQAKSIANQIIRLIYVFLLLSIASHQNGINNKEIHGLITELEDVQDILGSIHDSDMMIS
jgi:hypothetical protein